MMTLRRGVAATAVLPLFFGLAACGDDSETPASDSTTEAVTSEPVDDGDQGDDDPQGSNDPNDAAIAAIATAEQHADGTAYGLDDADDDGTWEVDVAAGSRTVEVEVDRAGSDVVGTERDDLDSDDRRALQNAQVSLTEAIEATLARNGGRIDDAELDDDDGRFRWQVSLRNGREFDVNLQNGKVSPDRDDDGDDRDND